MADLWDSLEEATTVLDEPFHREAICDALREAAATGRSLGARLAEAERLLQWVDDQGRLDARDAFDFREMHAKYKTRATDRRAGSESPNPKG